MKTQFFRMVTIIKFAITNFKYSIKLNIPVQNLLDFARGLCPIRLWDISPIRVSDIRGCSFYALKASIEYKI